MKRTIFLCFLFSISLKAMQPATVIRNQMLDAIGEANILEVKALVGDQSYTTYQTIPIMLNSQPTTDPSLYHFAKCEELKKEVATKTWCNGSFLKDLATSTGCLISAAFLGWGFFYEPMSAGTFDPLTNGAGIGGTAALLAAVGIGKAYKAFSNQTAIDKYARQVAITSLLKKKTQLCEEV